jgi:CheY-like chemotaxis protein
LQNRIQKRSEEVQTINAELHLEIKRRADAETELVSARKIAEDANANKTHLLALASHDILQPLNAAKLYLSALQEVSLADNASQIVQKLGDSLNASEVLIATLLDIARLDQGDMKPRLSSVSIKELVTPLIDELNMQAEEKGVQLKCRIQDVWLQTDRTYLYRILLNLLSNAIKYTPTGRVLLSARNRKNMVLIQIWDTGSGIHQDELNNIFGDFYRSGDHSQHGVGLGLGVVARLSQQLNAPVSVRSILGRGSCFSIELPSCSQDKPLGSKKVNVTKVGLAGLRVLCVDDKQENLDAMQTFLEKWQVNVTTALTPDEAMTELKRCEPQVIMMDYHLDSEVNGLQLIAKMRKFLGYPIPAVLVTANQDEEIVTESLNANCNYLSKPLKPAKLRALLQAVQVEGVRR